MACLFTACAACTPTVDLGRNTAGLTLVQSTVIVPQNGTASLQLSLTGDATGASVLFPFDAQLPTGVTAIVHHDAGSSGATITFTADPMASPQAAPGEYSLTVTARNTVTNAVSPARPFTLVVAIAATVEDTQDTTKGVDGSFVEVMSTSLQPADFQSSIPSVPSLAALNPPHLHVQVYKTPWVASTGQTADWDFTLLDSFVQTLLGVGDGQPELQIASPPAPALASGKYFNFGDETAVATFATYCGYLVSYYNKGGFTYGDGGPTIANTNPNRTPIAWWGILSDFNNNPDANPADYAHVYNEAVAAMIAVDPTIHLSALEFTDNASSAGTRPDNYLAPIVPSAVDAGGGGLSERVDSVSVHMFATNHSTTPDAQLLKTVAGFAADVRELRTILANSPLAGTPIWVTQSNVNADFPVTGGLSMSDMSQVFVKDPRGTDAFFAAWSPYMFSQLGQQGNGALYHWVYTAGHDPGDASQDLDIQNAEINYDDGTPFLSYWVDLALARTYGRDPSAPAPEILTTTTTETPPATVDVLATKRSDGTVVVMFSNIAADDLTKVDGPGLPRTVVVDVSAVATADFSATTLTIDSGGPVSGALTPLPPGLIVPMTLHGYGVELLTLTPPH